MPYDFKNLVFEGGGVKGIAYVGALDVLEKKGILPSITRVGGASAGAINALLLGLGYTCNEMLSILKQLDFRNFLDDDWGVIRDTNRLFTQYGIYKGDFFRAWAGDLIARKLNNREATFWDAVSGTGKGHCRDMYFITTNLSTGFSEVYSCEHTPRVTLADAVRMSMSIPLLFAAVRNIRSDVFVDGGVLDNYPIKLFDREKYLSPAAIGSSGRSTEYYAAVNARAANEGHTISSPYIYNKQTLGFRLDAREEIALFRDQAEPQHHKIDSLVSYGVRLIESFYSIQDDQHLHSDDWHRTIYIDTLGVGTTDFGLPEPGKNALVESGAKCTEAYFKWFDDPNHPVRPLNG
ncbi:patatin-like phospholipase family protein [Candidatus Uhrbacteria bacterium]|nr:patatin-like phospholipase family protein [Candidatus Uhrbacteria bacterium]